MKNVHWIGLIADLSRIKRTVNLKTEQKKVSNLRNTEKNSLTEQHLRDLWDNIMWSKFYITGIENGEREWGKL